MDPTTAHHHATKHPNRLVQRCFLAIVAVVAVGFVLLCVGCYYTFSDRQEFGPWLALAGVIAMLPCLLTAC